MAEKYQELQLENKWVKERRLPVINGSYPGSYYHVSVDGSDANATWPNPNLVPTEEEFELLASYNDFVIARQGYRSNYLKQMLEARPVDIDSGYNTTAFEKRPSGNWGYRKASFRGGSWPYWNAEVQYPVLADLIDHIESQFPERWDAWKKGEYDEWVKAHYNH